MKAFRPILLASLAVNAVLGALLVRRAPVPAAAVGKPAAVNIAPVQPAQVSPVAAAPAPVSLAEASKHFEAETARYRALAKAINLQPQ